MTPMNLNVNWALDNGPGPMNHDHGDPAVLTESTPAIYRRHDGSKRCTIDVRIHPGMRAVLISNAKSCEIYSRDRHGELEYEGFAKAELISTRRWKLEVAAEVSHMLHGLWLHHIFAPCLQRWKRTRVQSAIELTCEFWSKAGVRSVRLIMCGLYPVDELVLWPIILEPWKASHEPSEATNISTARKSQMHGIQQMLQHRTQDIPPPSDTDPKRRFMHALATAALRQTPRVRT